MASLFDIGIPPWLASTTLLGAAANPATSIDVPNILALLGERYRRRAEWNDRFAHWEKPASTTEEGTIERAIQCRGGSRQQCWGRCLICETRSMCVPGPFEKTPQDAGRPLIGIKRACVPSAGIDAVDPEQTLARGTMNVGSAP
jgi:hypothetical protein